MPRIETQTRCEPDRDGRAVDDGDQSERAGFFGKYAAVDHMQCLAQALVLGGPQRDSAAHNNDCENHEPRELTEPQQ